MNEPRAPAQCRAIHSCVYREPRPLIDVMESAEDWHTCQRAGCLDRSMDRAILAQRPVRAGLVVVGGISRQHSPQVRGAEDRDVVEDFAPN